MRVSVAAAHDLVLSLPPGDGVEAAHRAVTLRWLETTDDVFRRIKPATPDRHLVSYVVLRDPADGSIALVDHVDAGLWLPPGGHVEPDEHPVAAAMREAREELGPELAADVAAVLDPVPVFLTVTRTVGLSSGHTDVSLWFVASVRSGRPLDVDRTEAYGARWWPPTQVRAAGPAGFDPHLGRFLAKVAASR